MVRKTKKETMKTRKKLLDVALDVFFNNGYARASLDEIARKAGFTRGAVYWHFKNKSELFISLADEMEKKSGLFSLNGKEHLPKDLDELKEWVFQYLSFLEKNKQYQKFYNVVYFRTEWSKEIEPVLKKYQKQSRVFESVIAVTIEKCQQDFYLENLDSNLVALSVAVLIQGMIDKWFLDKKKFGLCSDTMKVLNHYLSTFYRREL